MLPLLLASAFPPLLLASPVLTLAVFPPALASAAPPQRLPAAAATTAAAAAATAAGAAASPGLLVSAMALLPRPAERHLMASIMFFSRRQILSRWARSAAPDFLVRPTKLHTGGRQRKGGTKKGRKKRPLPDRMMSRDAQRTCQAEATRRYCENKHGSSKDAMSL